MGILTALGAGLQNVGSFVGDVFGTFSQTPSGSQFLGQIGQLGLEQLGGLIGIKPTTVSGGPSQGFQTSPFTTFGPDPIGPLGRPMTHFPATAIDISHTQDFLNRAFATGDINVINAAAKKIAELMPNTIPFLHIPSAAGSPTPAPPSTPAFTPPAIPASQPFGRAPGDFSGGSMAFPVTRQASFPAPSFLDPFFGSGVQPASLIGSVARQLPGIAAGLGVGQLLEGIAGNGGGTPMFRPTMAGARAQFFRTANPATGQDTWFRPAGRPILWSGDLTACKRVNRVARRARRKR